MIYIRDAHGIRIGHFDNEVDALLQLRDLLDGYERQLFTLEQDGRTTHVVRLVGEIERVEE